MANKILIVDDDRATRDDLAQLLTHEGYETLTASDVPTAMHILGASAPDLLITDYRGPTVPVSQFMRDCLALHPKLRILMMSGFDQTSS